MYNGCPRFNCLDYIGSTVSTCTVHVVQRNLSIVDTIGTVLIKELSVLISKVDLNNKETPESDLIV